MGFAASDNPVIALNGEFGGIIQIQDHRYYAVTVLRGRNGLHEGPAFRVDDLVPRIGIAGRDVDDGVGYDMKRLGESVGALKAKQSCYHGDGVVSGEE